MPNMPNEYNYKIPSVQSQSKIISGPSNYYKNNNKKFIVNHPNQMQMVQELQNRTNVMAQRQPRAATQGGHIFNNNRGHAYNAVGSKLNNSKFVHPN